MSRPPRASESAVSLFPFLDVLMCTMGALILLLIALAIRMRPKASLEEMLQEAASGRPVAVTAPEEAPPALTQPKYTEEDRQRDLAERAARRERRQAEWSGALAAARADRDREQAALDEQRRLAAKVEREYLEARERTAEAARKSDAARDAQAAVLAAEKKLKGLDEQIVQQIETTRRNLDLEGRKQAVAANEFALVPYDGTSGTLRRPVYIECTALGFRFIQENVFVGPEHLVGFGENFNPLLTGTQALLRYWNSRRRVSDPDAPEPYVLLIVRPSGSRSYYEARKLLASLGANFGYELVEENWKLAVPEPDRIARAAVEDAIEITLEARDRARESLAGRGRGSGAVVLERNLPRNAFSDGFEREPGGASAGRNGTPGDRRGDRFDGRGIGGGSGGSQDSTNAAQPGPARSFADGRRSGVPGGVFDGSDAQPGSGLRGASRFGAGDRSGNSRGFSSEVGEPGGMTAFGDARTSRGTGQGAGGTHSASKSGRPGGARPATISGNDFSSTNDDPSSVGTEGRQGRRSGSGAPNAAVDDGEIPPLAPLPEEAAPARGRTPRVLTTNGPRTPGRPRPAESDENGTDPEGSDGPPEGTKSGLRSPGAFSAAAPGAGGSGAPGGGAVGENASGGVSFGNSGGSAGESPRPGAKRQWGRSSVRAGIGLERRLEIHVKGDRLLIGPKDAAFPADRNDKTEELVQRVLHGIDQASQNWGSPPANFYWLPAVKFVVYPGGNQFYERLRGPLEKYGISSTVQYELDEPTSGKRGGQRP